MVEVPFLPLHLSMAPKAQYLCPCRPTCSENIGGDSTAKDWTLGCLVWHTETAFQYHWSTGGLVTHGNAYCSVLDTDKQIHWHWGDWHCFIFRSITPYWFVPPSYSLVSKIPNTNKAATPWTLNKSKLRLSIPLVNSPSYHHHHL